MKIKLSQFQRGWISALIDGEGSLSVGFQKQKTSSRPAVRCIIAISNTDKELLEYAQKIMGGSLYKKTLSKDNRKQVYQLTLWANLIRKLLPLPLITKKRQQDILIETLSLLGQKGGSKIVNGKQVAATRPLWKDKRIAELKAELNRINRRGREKADPELIVRTNV